MKRNLLMCICLVSVTNSIIPFVASFPEEENTDLEFQNLNLSSSSSAISNRALKWFPFLAVVTFPNTKCTMGVNTGLCYKKSQCLAKGGTDLNFPCAQGYGTCCQFIKSCSGLPGMTTVTMDLTHVIGSNFNDTQRPCSIKIPKQAGVCQIRVDFVLFEVGMSDLDGNCPLDNIKFLGAANLMPDGLTICGTNTGQHLYLDYGDSDTVSIIANLETGNSKYDFQITMIKCNSPDKPPMGCTQFFTSPKANVTSFNYPVHQLNSERYSVCVRSPGSMIIWSPCSATSQFFISGDGISSTDGLEGTDKCTLDYVLIPPNNVRCGPTLIGPVKSTMKPFTLFVHFDDSEIPPIPDMNPETGCPLGFNCTAPILPCQSLDTCDAPTYMAELIDNGNTGFCLTYTVS